MFKVRKLCLYYKKLSCRNFCCTLLVQFFCCTILVQTLAARSWCSSLATDHCCRLLLLLQYFCCSSFAAVSSLLQKLLLHTLGAVLVLHNLDADSCCTLLVQFFGCRNFHLRRAIFHCALLLRSFLSTNSVDNRLPIQINVCCGAIKRRPMAIHTQEYRKNDYKCGIHDMR